MAVTRLLREFPQARVSIVDGPYEELLHALLHARTDVIVGALRRPTQVIECNSLVATRGMLLNSERAALLSAQQLEVDIDAGLLAIAAASLPGDGDGEEMIATGGLEPPTSYSSARQSRQFICRISFIRDR